MLAVARLADAAAREIHDLGEACFSRPGPGPDPNDLEDGSDTTNRDVGIRTGASPSTDGTDANDARDARRASRAMARLFRCSRVIEAATFGCTPCASALVTGDLGRPPPRGKMALVPMRTNEAIASPAPRGHPAGRGGGVAKGPGATPGEEDAGDAAGVMGHVRVRGIHLTPRVPRGRGVEARARRRTRGRGDDAEEVQNRRGAPPHAVPGREAPPRTSRREGRRSRDRRGELAGDRRGELERQRQRQLCRGRRGDGRDVLASARGGARRERRGRRYAHV